ncbi:DNA-binding transcriptional regulator GbsR (MarR family) [Alkalibacillus flavidus]|uniref:HTH-type transcriptional regulator n=1 Tax=Alkalibacillus flavidus TaxID=546021 RepID=A0ABV2KXV7_9BACI
MQTTEWNDSLETFHYNMISEFSKTLEMFSLNTTESQLFVTLYLSEDPMTLDDMKHALGKSKTAMNNAVRTLLDYNLVERVWKKGVRKDLYQAEKDLYDKFMRAYVNRWLEAIERQKSNLQQIEKQFANEPSKHNHQTNEKLQEAIKFHNTLEDVFNDLHKE